jgi:hypothetical protein
MKTFSKIKQWLVSGCVWYAVISLIFLIIDIALSNTKATHVISSTSFLLIFPFGLSMSGAGMLYRSKLPRWSRILSHYVISVVSFLLFMLLPAGSASSGVYVLLMLVLLTVIYWILFALVHIFAKRWKRVIEED